MAEGFLLADLTFRESWETHREGMLGSDQVSARFPAGLILEILCLRGHPLGTAVADFIAHAEANGFRYYDHPGADPDSDTLGAVLRLLPYAAGEHQPSARLQEMLDCVERLVADLGNVPVWLTSCGEAGQRTPALTLGERCGTVAAHLLLGLAEHQTGRLELVEAGCSALYERIASVGLGANVNYPPRYALAIYFRLLDQVDDGEARTALVAELERRCAMPIRSAQEAALTALAVRAAGRPDLFRPDWISTILKQQRFDGSWIGEPFAVAPSRGWQVSAYSSTTLTTALCYHALAGVAEHAPAEG